jgi:hypothetical protein
MSSAQRQRRCKDRIIRKLGKLRMKPAKPLGDARIACSVSFEQVFRLVFEVFEIGLRGKAPGRPDELPFLLSPRPHCLGRKSVRKQQNF